jgi:ABC-2 type transport system permease protein
MTTLPTLLGLRLRRDRLQLVVWLGSTFLLALLSARALATTYGTEAERASLVRLATANASVLALRGAPQGTSPGALVAFELMAYVALLAGFLNTFLAVRHTRAEEDSGRAELVGATRAGRFASVAATVLEGVIVAAALTVFVWVALLAAGLPVVGSLVAGLAVAACGLAFLGVGLLCAEIFSVGRAANGWAAALVGVAFGLRAIGDATGGPSADQLSVRTGWVTWLSPIGWAQQTNPYTANRLWPTLLAVGFGAALVAAAVLVHAVRDLGAGVVPDRPRRATAAPMLRGPIGLAWRLQRGSIIGWALGALGLAVLAGRLGPAAIDAMEENPGLRKILDAMASGAHGSGLQIFLVSMLGILGLMVAGFLLQVVMRVRQEEATGTAELVLSTSVSRLRWLAAFLVVGLVAAVVVLFCCGLVIAEMIAASGYGNLADDVVMGSMAQLPAALVYLAVLSVVFAVVPRATIGVGWSMFAAGAFVSLFGQLIHLPAWFRDIAPSVHTPALPLGNADWTGAWSMLALSVLLAVAAGWILRHRDLPVG